MCAAVRSDLPKLRGKKYSVPGTCAGDSPAPDACIWHIRDLSPSRISQEAVGVVTNVRKQGYMGKAGATVALTVLFGPIGFLKRGHDVDIKAGTPLTAEVDQGFDAVVH